LVWLFSAAGLSPLKSEVTASGLEVETSRFGLGTDGARPNADMSTLLFFLAATLTTVLPFDGVFEVVTALAGSIFVFFLAASRG